MIRRVPARLDYALHSNDEYTLFSIRIRPAGAIGPGTYPRFRIPPHYPWPAKRGGRACRTRTPPLATVALTEGVRATAFERSWSAFVATRGWLDGNIVTSYVASSLGAAGGAARCTYTVRARQSQTRAR